MIWYIIAGAVGYFVTTLILLTAHAMCCRPTPGQVEITRWEDITR
jgi:hypothetical protein